MPGSLLSGLSPQRLRLRGQNSLLLVGLISRLLCSAFPSRDWHVVPTPATGQPGWPKTCPCGASCMLHPLCSVTSRPPGTRPVCPPQAVSLTRMVLGSEAHHECVCPSSSRPGLRAISSPIWRPRPGAQWPQVSRWVPEGPGRPGGWIKAVGEGVALDDLMQGRDPCSGWGRCGLVLGDRQPRSACLCPRSVLDARRGPASCTPDCGPQRKGASSPLP